MSARQVSASELLMNLGLLVAAQAQQAVLRSLSEDAKVRNIDDTAAPTLEQISKTHIPQFFENLRGCLEQYLLYLPVGEQRPFISLLKYEPSENETISSEHRQAIFMQNTPELEQSLRKSVVDISKNNFKVAMSFPGQVRDLVKTISDNIEGELGKGSVFYDNYYVSQLARPGLDTFLQGLYRNRASLIVVFLSGSYQDKKWCGVEFRAIREIIFERQHERVMFVRTGEGAVDGVFDTDGYVDARNFSALEIAGFIMDRINLLELTSEATEPEPLVMHNVNMQTDHKVQQELDGLDIKGQWELSIAKGIAELWLERNDWRTVDSNLEFPLRHSFAGEYHLFYKNREGFILAFGTITEGSDCHACSPYLSLFEFEKCEGGWKLVTSDVGICRAGQWGELPRLGVHAIADGRYGVFIHDGYMAQGWGVGTTSVHVRVGNKFKQVLNLITSQSDPEGRAWTSKLTMRETISGLYDIEVNRSGENGPLDLVFMEGDEFFKLDVADFSGRIRSHDVFKFDGQYYRRHDILT
jgi:hypothetical protein